MDLFTVQISERRYQSDELNGHASDLITGTAYNTAYNHIVVDPNPFLHRWQFIMMALNITSMCSQHRYLHDQVESWYDGETPLPGAQLFVAA